MIVCNDFHIAPLEISDAKSLSKLMVLNWPSFRRYMPKTLEKNLSKKASELFIAVMNSEKTRESLRLFALKTGTEVAGLIYIKNLDFQKKEGEFAYCIGNEFSGKGRISEGVEKLSTHAFSELCLKKLKIITHKTNIASVKVAQKCRFLWKETLKNEFTPLNEAPLDMELYVLEKTIK